MLPFGSDLNIDLQGAQPLDRPLQPRPLLISSKCQLAELREALIQAVRVCPNDAVYYWHPRAPFKSNPYPTFPILSKCQLAKLLLRGRHLWMKSIFYYYSYNYKYLYLLLLVNELHLLLLLLPVLHTTTCGWTPPINELTRRNPIPSSALTSLRPHFANCKQIFLDFKSISLVLHFLCLQFLHLTPNSGFKIKYNIIILSLWVSERFGWITDWAEIVFVAFTNKSK